MKDTPDLFISSLCRFKYTPALDSALPLFDIRLYTGPKFSGQTFQKDFEKMSEILKTHQNWMSQALAEAKQCDQDVPVGAALVRDGKLICLTRNRKEELNDPTAHAEILAIRQGALLSGSWRLSGTTLYTTLEPCPMCAEAIMQARVSTLVFGAYDPLSGAVGSAFNLYAPKRIYPVPEVLGGILGESCSQILKDFFQTRK